VYVPELIVSDEDKPAPEYDKQYETDRIGSQGFVLDTLGCVHVPR